MVLVFLLMYVLIGLCYMFGVGWYYSNYNVDETTPDDGLMAFSALIGALWPLSTLAFLIWSIGAGISWLWRKAGLIP